VELRDLEAYGEPGAVVYLADCVELMRLMPAGSVDVIFADPPYRLSTGGVTVRSGRLAPVDKGGWDRSLGSFEKDHAFNVMLSAALAIQRQQMPVNTRLIYATVNLAAALSDSERPWFGSGLAPLGPTV
jgi:16S rRNA G966 N2-methylase RsmD